MKNQRDVVQVSMATKAKAWPDLRNVRIDALVHREKTLRGAGLHLAARVMRNEIEARNDRV